MYKMFHLRICTEDTINGVMLVMNKEEVNEEEEGEGEVE